MRCGRLVTLCGVVFGVALSGGQSAAAQNGKYIFSGAVISASPKMQAFSAVNTGLVQHLSNGYTAERLGAGVLLVRVGKQMDAQSSGAESPKLYTRRSNPCKRAKMRRMLKQLRGRPRCEPNYAYFASAAPNDSFYSYQYASTPMSLPAAWDKTTGSSNRIVLVIDTGVLYTHPDLAANMWANPGEVPGDGIDNDSNGYVDDVYGINAITNSGNPLDDHGHGTHCAGILGGHGNNGQGVAGVAWNTKIVAAKFLSSSGSGSLSNAIKSINYGTALRLAGHNVVVSNNSWGGGSYSPTLAAAIAAAGDAGILFVAAAGNSSSDNDASPSYPASYTHDSVLAVASTTSSNALSSFSNFGASSVDIAAPGSSIISTYLSNDYAYLSGTSMAAPQVSGVALLVQSVCSNVLTVSQVKTAILSTGQWYASLYEKVSTSSIVNASNAIDAAYAYCTTATPTPTPTPTQTPDTPTPTPQPTQTPTPLPTSPIIVRPTPTPSTGRVTFVVSPKQVSPNTQASIAITNASGSRAASLRIFGRDSRWTYACPTIALPLASGAATVNFTMPQSVTRFRTLQFFAAVGRANLQSQVSVASPQPARNFRDGQAAFNQVCTTIARAAARSAAAQRRRLLGRE